MGIVLITGGSGLVGSYLSSLLSAKNYIVRHLSRNPSKRPNSGISSYKWDINNNFIDKKSLKGVDSIVNLAGAGISNRYWTPAYKRTIYNSRIMGTRLLVSSILSQKDNTIKTMISSSAIGVYLNRKQQWIDEKGELGTSFLSRLCQDWEKEIDKLNQKNIRIIKLRTGIVLSDKGGFLTAMRKLTRFGLNVKIDKGKDYMSWIHINDLCNIIINAIENNAMKGIYNAISPNPITNKEFILSMNKKFSRRSIIPSMPSMAIKLLMGDMSDIILQGGRVNCNKLIDNGIKFKFLKFNDALNSFYN